MQTHSRITNYRQTFFPSYSLDARKVGDKTPGYFTFRELLETPYMKALTRYTSNEPEGIEKIMPLLHDSNFHWLPLNEAFAK